MLLTQWSHWHPLKQMPSHFYVNTIVDQGKSLEIILILDDASNPAIENPQQKKLRIFFEKSVVFYKLTDLHCIMDDIFILKKEYGEKFITTATFFKITNSKYLNWLHEESLENNNLPLIHFVIIELSSQIDILATQEPLVEWIQHA